MSQVAPFDGEPNDSKVYAVIWCSILFKRWGSRELIPYLETKLHAVFSAVSVIRNKRHAGNFTLKRPF